MSLEGLGAAAAIAAFLLFAIFGSRGIVDAVRAVRSRNKAEPVPVPVPETGTQLIQTYRERVTVSHERLRFGDPTSASGKSAEGPTGISLADIYTPLSVATEFGTGEPKNVRPAQLRIPVAEALSSLEAHRALVLGDPGAGKSTLVDYMVGDALKNPGGVLPVHVRLSELTNVDQVGIWAGVLEVHHEGAPEPTMVAAIEDTLANEGGLILFDGLDEVPADSVETVTAAIVATSNAYSKAQVVVTCRSWDYYQSTPSRQLPAEFTKWRLLPFTLDDMLSYVDRWYRALATLKFISGADERKRNLQDSLRNSPELENLAATPLLLALMALVHTNEGELPSARSVLYHRAVVKLLADTPEWRSAFVTEAVPTEEMLTIATDVAFQVQMREARSATDGKFVGLTISEIEQVVREDVERRGMIPVNSVKFPESVAGRLERIIQSNGLLVEQSSGHYHFAHRSLQEFLAGAHLLNGADYPLTLGLSKLPAWHEPFVLMAGYGSREARSLFFLTSLIADLAAEDSPDLQGQLLAGEMLAEIGRETLRAQRFERLVDDEAESGELPLWARIVSTLERWLAADLSVPERISVLKVLGRLGDPRLGDATDWLESFQARMVDLDEMSLSIGDDGRDRPRAKSSLVETAPARKVHINAFRVSKFPVTNFEYSFFVADGGYRNDRWWLPDGLRWLSGDSEFASTLEQSTVEWIHRDFQAEIDMGRFRMEDVLLDAAAMSRPRTEPFYWRNARYNQSNQPVVGINWWEANAYCSWLTETLRRMAALEDGVIARLPNEWEWERYARGVDDGRYFPWGSDEDTRQRAHTRFDGLDLDAATPVGAFPLGRTHDQLMDVAGNVWEWTASRALPMGVHHDRKRHRVDGVVDVVVRGGSWFSDVDGAVRCGYRGIDLPQNVYYDVGIRVILSRD